MLQKVQRFASADTGSSSTGGGAASEESSSGRGGSKSTQRKAMTNRTGQQDPAPHPLPSQPYHPAASPSHPAGAYAATVGGGGQQPMLVQQRGGQYGKAPPPRPPSMRSRFSTVGALASITVSARPCITVLPV